VPEPATSRARCRPKLRVEPKHFEIRPYGILSSKNINSRIFLDVEER
jgi:hypothetical protein